jgi:hypothetical protein
VSADETLPSSGRPAAADASLLSAPADSVGGVLERMDLIEQLLPRDDGISYFNRMYREVTRSVQSRLAELWFEQEPFMDRLDVVFANEYFQAVDQSLRGLPIAPAWEPLFRWRDRPNTAPIQFALAGMNAHINHDLSVAVVDTCRELGLPLEDATPAHRDFVKVNEILRATEGDIKRWFETGVIADTADMMDKVEDALEYWSLCEARDIAWGNAKILWRLSSADPHLREAYLAMLRRLVELAGRGILL